MSQIKNIGKKDSGSLSFLLLSSNKREEQNDLPFPIPNMQNAHVFSLVLPIFMKVVSLA